MHDFAFVSPVYSLLSINVFWAKLAQLFNSANKYLTGKETFVYTGPILSGRIQVGSKITTQKKKKNKKKQVNKYLHLVKDNNIHAMT